MRIHSITVRNYRIHREVTVELDRQTTVIGGPNEIGKSTLVEAAHRALFLKAGTSGILQKEMLSLSGHGPPEVEVCFEAGGQTYTIRKRFSGTSGTAQLTQHNGSTWHNSEAESRLADILGQAALGGKVAGGLSRTWEHLWVWQGCAQQDPLKLEGAPQQDILQRLRAVGGAVVMQSELDARVGSEIAKQHDAAFVARGKVKSGSDLAKALQGEVEARDAWNRARDNVEKLDEAIRQIDDAEQTLARCRGERASNERDLATVQASLASLYKMEGDRDVHERQAKEAEEKYQSLAAIDESIRNRLSEIHTRETALAPRMRAIDDLNRTAESAKALVEETYESWRQSLAVATAARCRADLATAYEQLYDKRAQRDKCARQWDEVLKLRSELAKIEKEYAELPAITEDLLTQLREWEAGRREAQATLQAIATGVEVLVADVPVRVGEVILGVGQTRIVDDRTEMTVGDGVHLVITPGGGNDLQHAKQQLATVRAALQDALAGYGIESLDEASDLCRRRNHLQGQMETLQQELDRRKTLESELAQLKSQCEAAANALATLRATVSDFNAPGDLEQARQAARDEARRRNEAEVECTTRTQQHDESKATWAERVQTLQQQLDAIGQEEAELEQLKQDYQSELRLHGDDDSRAADLLRRRNTYESAARELADIQRAIDELQPELLRADEQRLIGAIDQGDRTQEEAKKRLHLAQGSLMSDGSHDPRAEEAIAQARHAAAKERLSRVQQRADAIRLLRDLFRDEQQSLANEFARPFAERVASYLQCMFGPTASAHICLRELQFTELALVRPQVAAGAVAFDALSVGTREQLAAAVRLAMAELLAEKHDGCLPVIFDDAFAYSDPHRVRTLQRMLYHAASRGLQLIVLTCNPADYASLGARQISLTSPALQDLPRREAGMPRYEPAETHEEMTSERLPDSTADGLGERLLELLSVEGAPRSNLWVRERLQVDENTYEATKQQLVAQGKIITGRGRGGTIALARS